MSLHPIKGNYSHCATCSCIFHSIFPHEILITSTNNNSVIYPNGRLFICQCFEIYYEEGVDNIPYIKM